MFTRSVIASCASAQMRAIAWSIPSGPSCSGQVMSIVRAANTSWAT